MCVMEMERAALISPLPPPASIYKIDITIPRARVCVSAWAWAWQKASNDGGVV